jgi:hypothetical protein
MLIYEQIRITQWQMPEINGSRSHSIWVGLSWEKYPRQKAIKRSKLPDNNNLILARKQRLKLGHRQISIHIAIENKIALHSQEFPEKHEKYWITRIA